MKKNIYVFLLFIFLPGFSFLAQTAADVVKKIQKEAIENSQLERLAHEMTDVIGPRLVGTPEMKKAHDWAVEQFESWGISARNEQWGEWRGWQRGICHIDMVAPRIASLEEPNWPGVRLHPKKALLPGW